MWVTRGGDEVWPALPVPLPLLSCCMLGWVSDVVNQLSLSNAAGSGAAAGFGTGVVPARLCSGSASLRHSPPKCAPRAKRLVETGVQRERGSSPPTQTTGAGGGYFTFSPAQCFPTQPLFSFPCCFL